MSPDDVDTQKHYLPPLRPQGPVRAFFDMSGSIRRMTQATRETLIRASTEPAYATAPVPPELFNGCDWPEWAVRALLALEAEQ
jgi:hypothetical protein